MEPTRTPLPDSVPELQAMVHSLREEFAQIERTLRARIDTLERMLFGKSSEKTDKKDRRITPASPGRPERKARPHGRGPIPGNLPRDTEAVEPPESKDPCPACGKDRIRIDEEAAEQVDWIPGRIVVRRRVRGVWACSCGQCPPVTAEPPPRPNEHGMFTMAFIAMLLSDKFADHLPIHRTKQRLARLGGDFHLNTLLDQVKLGAETLEPIVEFMRAARNASPILHVDDTGILVLGDEKSKEHDGHIWIYLAIDDEGQPTQATFEYTQRRAGSGKNGPKELLAGYRGTIVADAFTGFDALFGPDKATEAGCWMHARRGFFKVISDPDGKAAVDQINALYDIEREAKDEKMPPAARLALRREKSRPLVEAFFAWIQERQPRVPPKTPMGEALGYATNQKKALMTFLEDGRIEMDNGYAERGMRGVAVGRKNWIFAGSDKAAQRTATIYSLVTTCRLLGIDPHAYLKDVLERVDDHPEARIAELTPSGWKAANAATAPSPA